MQNVGLVEEYSRGSVWGHKPAVLEVGGLVCHISLKAEIYHRRPVAQSMLHGRLRLFLQSEKYGRADDRTTLLPIGPRSLAFTGEAAAASLSMLISIGIRLVEVSGDDNNDDANLPSFSVLISRMVFLYRGAERLLRRDLAAIMSKASPNSRIDPNSLSLESLELLQLYMDHQNTWQEVCLVIKRNERTGRSVMVHPYVANVSL